MNWNQASPGSSIASQNAGIEVNQSERLVRNSGQTVGTVKSLFDSCYLPPERNPKVK